MLNVQAAKGQLSCAEAEQGLQILLFFHMTHRVETNVYFRGNLLISPMHPNSIESEPNTQHSYSCHSVPRPTTVAIYLLSPCHLVALLHIAH